MSTNEEDAIKAELANYIESLRPRFPVLFTAGKESEEALAAVIREAASDAVTATKLLYGEQLYVAMARGLNEDVLNIERVGVPADLLKVVAQEPANTVIDLVAANYFRALTLLDLFLRPTGHADAKAVAETCDCDVHRSLRDGGFAVKGGQE